MANVGELASILHSISTEQNNKIRQAAETALTQQLFSGLAVHFEIMDYIRKMPGTGQTKMLLVFAKKSLSQEQNPDFDTQEQLKAVIEGYLRLFFEEQLDVLCKQLLVEIILKAADQTQNPQTAYLYVNGTVWSHLGTLAINPLYSAMLFLKALSKKQNDMRMATDACQIDALIDLHSHLFPALAALTQQETSGAMETWLVVNLYISNLLALKARIKHANDQKLHTLLISLLNLLRHSFFNSENGQNDIILYSNLNESDQNVVMLALKVKTRITKFVQKLHDLDNQVLKFVFSEAITVAKDLLLQTASLTSQLSFANQPFKKFVYRLLNLLSCASKDKNRRQFFQLHRNELTGIIFNLIAADVTWNQEEAKEHLELIEDAIEGCQFETVIGGALELFKSICDYVDNYFVQFLEEVIPEIANKVPQILSADANQQSSPAVLSALSSCHAQSLMLCTASYVRHLQIDQLQKIYDMCLVLASAVGRQKNLSADLFMLAKYYASEFACSFEFEVFTKEFLFPMLECALVALSKESDELMFYSALKFIDFCLSTEFLEENKQIAILISHKADIFSVKLAQSYQKLGYKHFHGCLKSFIGNLASSLSLKSLTHVLNILCQPECLASPGILMEVLDLQMSLFMLSKMTPNDLYEFDNIACPFWNSVINSADFTVIDDNFATLIHASTKYQQSASLFRVELLNSLLPKMVKQPALIDSQFLSINALIVYGHQHFSFKTVEYLTHFLSNHEQNAKALFLLIAVVQNATEFLTSSVVSRFVSIWNNALSGGLAFANDDVIRGILYLFFSFVVCVPLQSHPAELPEIALNLVGFYLTNSSLMSTVAQRKVATVALLGLIQTSPYSVQLQTVLNRVVIVAFDNIHMASSIDQTVHKNAASQLLLAKRTNLEQKDPENNEAIDQPIKDLRNFLDHNSFINSPRLPDEVQCFKRFCQTWKTAIGEKAFNDHLKQFPIAVREYIVDCFSIQAVVVDPENNVVQNRKIVRIKRKKEDS